MRPRRSDRSILYMRSIFSPSEICSSEKNINSIVKDNESDYRYFFSKGNYHRIYQIKTYPRYRGSNIGSIKSISDRFFHSALILPDTLIAFFPSDSSQAQACPLLPPVRQYIYTGFVQSISFERWANAERGRSLACGIRIILYSSCSRTSISSIGDLFFIRASSSWWVISLYIYIIGIRHYEIFSFSINRRDEKRPERNQTTSMTIHSKKNICP